MNRGYVHIYTGNGKGKTTAAFGVVLRTLMCDRPVYVGQFVKGMKYSETRLEAKVEGLTVEQYGLDCFIDHDPAEADRERAEAGYFRALEVVRAGTHALVVLDEIFIALYYGLLSEDKVAHLIAEKAEQVELILTGRYCPESLYEKADLVTEMLEIKHYYSKGVLSREGVDC